MAKFNVGTRVHLREDSEWFRSGDVCNPHSTSIHGTITHINPVDGFDYRVKWNGIEHGNVYRENDLALVETKEKQPMSETNEYKPFGELSREEQIELFNAWLDGKEIEYIVYKKWSQTAAPLWDSKLVYRVKPVALTKPSIDWSAVHPDYKWIAFDEDGYTYLYKEEPRPEWSKWHNDTYEYVGTEGFASFKPGTCDWKDSLVQRPEGA